MQASSLAVLPGRREWRDFPLFYFWTAHGRKSCAWYDKRQSDAAFAAVFAAATILAQGISAGLGLVYIVRGYPQLRFGREEFRVKRGFVLKKFWTGLSMALMSTVYNVGSVILQSSINALGNIYITAQVGRRRLAELFYTVSGGWLRFWLLFLALPGRCGWLWEACIRRLSLMRCSIWG